MMIVHQAIHDMQQTRISVRTRIDWMRVQVTVDESSLSAAYGA